VSRLAVLSDIHSNRQALDAVLADMEKQKVQGFICLGDVVGYNADPAYCLDAVRAGSKLTVKGNHDRAAHDASADSWFNGTAGEAIRWCRRQLNASSLAWLASLPDESLTFEGAWLCHGSLRDPDEYIADGVTAIGSLQMVGAGFAFHGHTHIPGVFQLEGERPNVRLTHTYRPGLVVDLASGRMLVNPGSVGQPRDGNPKASYGIWDQAAKTFTFRRLTYRVVGAQKAVLAAGLPERLAERLAEGR